MSQSPQTPTDIASTLLDGRYRWWLRATAALVLLLVFFAYQQYELLIGWVNAFFC